METTRFILVIALCLVSLMLWQEWEKDYGEPAAVETVTVTAGENAQTPDFEELPQQEVAETAATVETKTIVNNSSPVAAPAAKTLVLESDVLRLEVSTRGGGIEKASLKKYPASADTPDVPFVLLDNTEELVYLVQGGLLSNEEAPTHQAVYRAAGAQHSLAEGEDRLVVPMTWQSANGMAVTKTYTLTRGSYLIEVAYSVENSSADTWKGRAYQQIKRSAPTEGRRLIYTYTGAVISSPEERYEKIDFDDMSDQKLERDIKNGWVAMLQHYFVTALVPTDKERSYRYYTSALANEKYLLGAIGPVTQVSAGDSTTIKNEIYLGPKILEDLDKITDGLELTVDYGMLWFIAKPLFLVLNKLHDLTSNWGWSIILVTIILKLLFFPLSAAGYKSMANMRRVQPRLVALKDRYKDDRNKLNQAMMQIYKEEKINPFGGCFPILVQIPVFIALYWVLLESVELRQASFALWLTDLSSKDPFYVLPVLMGITMFVQQKLNPPPMDPVQEKVMSFLPFIFTVFFAFFPSGLVLYWVVNNILSIAQQWQITRSLEKAGIATKS